MDNVPREEHGRGLFSMSRKARHVDHWDHAGIWDISSAWEIKEKFHLKWIIQIWHPHWVVKGGYQKQMKLRLSWTSGTMTSWERVKLQKNTKILHPSHMSGSNPNNSTTLLRIPKNFSSLFSGFLTSCSCWGCSRRSWWPSAAVEKGVAGGGGTPARSCPTCIRCGRGWSWRRGRRAAAAAASSDQTRGREHECLNDEEKYVWGSNKKIWHIRYYTLETLQLPFWYNKNFWGRNLAWDIVTIQFDTMINQLSYPQNYLQW